MSRSKCTDIVVLIEYFTSLDTSHYEEIASTINRISSVESKTSKTPYVNAHMERPAHTYINELL